MNTQLNSLAEQLLKLSNDDLYNKLTELDFIQEQIKMSKGMSSGEYIECSERIKNLVKELKNRKQFLDELVKKLSGEYMEIDSKIEYSLEYTNVYIPEETRKQYYQKSRLLYLLGYSSEGIALKTPDIQAQVSAKVSQLAFPGFEYTTKKRKKRKK